MAELPVLESQRASSRQRTLRSSNACMSPSSRRSVSKQAPSKKGKTPPEPYQWLPPQARADA